MVHRMAVHRSLANMAAISRSPEHVTAFVQSANNSRSGSSIARFHYIGSLVRSSDQQCRMTRRREPASQPCTANEVGGEHGMQTRSENDSHRSGDKKTVDRF